MIYRFRILLKRQIVKHVTYQLSSVNIFTVQRKIINVVSFTGEEKWVSKLSKCKKVRKSSTNYLVPFYTSVPSDAQIYWRNFFYLRLQKWSLRKKCAKHFMKITHWDFRADVSSVKFIINYERREQPFTTIKFFMRPQITFYRRFKKKCTWKVY